MADYLYVLVFLTCAYSKCMMKDFMMFSCTEVGVFPITKTVLGFSGLLCVVSEAVS